MIPKGIYIKKATCIVLFHLITGYAHSLFEGFKNYIPTFNTAYCNVSNSSSKMNAFKGSRIAFKSPVSMFPFGAKDITDDPGAQTSPWRTGLFNPML